MEASTSDYVTDMWDQDFTKEELDEIDRLTSKKRKHQVIYHHEESGFDLLKICFNNKLQIFGKKVNYIDIEALLSNEKGNISLILQQCINNSDSPCIKAKAIFSTRFYKEETQTNTYFHCAYTSISSIEIIDEYIHDCFEQLINQVDQFTQRGSGWILDNIFYIELRIAKYRPHTGGCDSVSLPHQIKSKKAILNIRTKNDCFMYSILAGLHSVQNNQEKTSSYKNFISLYDFSNHRGDVSIVDIGKFEARNLLSINVYALEFGSKKNIYPLRITKNRREKHVNLFLNENHYCLIRNLNRLLASKNSWQHYFCESCLTGFKDLDSLEKHKSYCDIPQAIITPDPGSKCYFHEFNKTEKYPFVMYADFETLATKPEDDIPEIYQNHVAISFGVVVVDWNKNIIFQQFYHGEDCVKMFFEFIYKAYHDLMQILDENLKPLPQLTIEEEDGFKNAEICVICNKSLDGTRVRDHNHLTGKYRGAAHKICNFQREVSRKIPIFFHNFKNFDSHLLIRGLDSTMFRSIKVLPQNIDKFTAVFMDNFIFLDSFSFLPSSLDKLAESLTPESKNEFLLQVFKPEDIPLISKKGAIPYDYIDTFEKFQDTQLPSKAQFYNKLTRSNITDEVYDRLVNMWHHFKCSNLGNFIDIYLRIDVILLAAVFESFRDMSLREFSLDPAHFFSIPGLTWCASLRYTKMELELISDPEMILFIERGIRGGITSVIHRYAEANNPGLSTYNSQKETSYISYLDVNNLYGYALSKPLPYANFEWIEYFDGILDHPDDIGYFLEVDLEYPLEVHDAHNDYPLAPEKKVVDPKNYSLYQSQLSTILGEAGLKNIVSEKLLPNLNDKERYVLYSDNLKFYIEKGLILKKVHRVLKFSQKPWLSSYINLCTTKRQQSTTSFQKDFWKLMVNALYGKSIEDKRKHCKVEIVKSDIRAEKLIRKNHMEQISIINEDLAIFKMKNKRVFMNKPIYMGFTVLERSKLLMYHLHYNIFKAHYGDNIKLLYTDTDSFIYFIKTDNISRDFKNFSHIMDFSDYPENHPLYSLENKKKLGYLKDEMSGKQIHFNFHYIYSFKA